MTNGRRQMPTASFFLFSSFADNTCPIRWLEWCEIDHGWVSGFAPTIDCETTARMPATKDICDALSCDAAAA